mmetsp:Transcript_78921/g.124600  ORF Transcript_78921/g.124600 Transcript_78921/m.124600 type:complete len:295 (-) Transcript_78921:162-1046(-)
MAPTTVDIHTKVSAPPPEGLLRLTTSGGTEVNLQFPQESSPKPLFIRGTSGHFDLQAEIDPEPAKLDIPWPSLLMEKQTRVPASYPHGGDEFACHKSQCSTEDPNEEASPPLSPRSAPVSGAPAETGQNQLVLPDSNEYSSALPTKGSAGHYAGKCKPCAFVFKDGCESGVNCEFCHLCAPGEKKRRKKDRRHQRLSRTQNAQHEAQYETQCEPQYQEQLPPPPPPPMTPWLHDNSLQSTYTMDDTQNTYHMQETNSYTLGSKAWQLEKSQARSHTQYSYHPHNPVMPTGYHGW